MLAPTTVTIAHVSDIHVGAHDDLALDGLAPDLHTVSAAATVVTGDLTMRARSHEFARAKQVIDQFPSPTMIVLGNHDIPLTNLFRRLASPYRKFSRQISADLDPVLSLAGVRILGLQSMPRWRWKSGRVSDRQAQLIRTTFADSPPGVTRVVALHHPPSSQKLESLAGRDDFEQALVDAEVDIVLAGHTHVPAVTELEIGSRPRTRRVLEIVAGTATSHRTRGIHRSWSAITLAGAQVTVTTHVSDDNRWSIGVTEQFSLAPGSHRPDQ